MMIFVALRRDKLLLFCGEFMWDSYFKTLLIKAFKLISSFCLCSLSDAGSASQLCSFLIVSERM